MKQNKSYSEVQVVASLNEKFDIKIFGKQIQELSKGKGDVGIKSRGKIDFLCTHCGYSHFYVAAFDN